MAEDAKGRQDEAADARDGDLSDLNDELRVLLPGTTTLTAFLIILPFNSGFSEIRDEQKAVYLITFLCSVFSLILFTAPAAHHRLQRPLRDRERYKDIATRMIIIGLVPFSVAIPLATSLVITATLSNLWFSWTVAGVVGVVIAALWWIFPMMTRHDMSGHSE